MRQALVRKTWMPHCSVNSASQGWQERLTRLVFRVARRTQQVATQVLPTKPEVGEGYGAQKAKADKGWPGDDQLCLRPRVGRNQLSRQQAWSPQARGGTPWGRSLGNEVLKERAKG